jgi:sugar O-acyltransferase (sialic acid O-acetyltransferase NeuD family)
MRDIVIFGAGAQAELAYFCFCQDGQYRVAAFTVHEAYLKEQELLDLAVVPFEHIEQMYPPDQFGIFVAMGYQQLNKARATVYNACLRMGYDVVSYVSPRACLYDQVDVGQGCFILENTTIQPFANIGRNVFIGPGTIIGHHVIVGDHTFIAAGAVILGRVTVGPYCFIGAHATLRDGIAVASECVIGAGAVVMRRTQEREVHLARPAEVASKSSDVLSAFLNRRP